MFVYELLERILNHKVAAAVTLLVLITACPLMMAVENWDDHDRSGRYTARDIGANYLESTAPNSILFTYGDNDSFPVWYVQDVEGIRSDVRVANLSYIQAGWYIEMMKLKAFDSDPMPLTLGNDKYMDGIRTQLPVVKRIETPVRIGEIVQFAGMDDRNYMIDYSGQGDYLNYLPANKFIIDVDTSLVLANGTVKKYFSNRILSPIVWEYTDGDAFKGDLAIMDLLSTNKWNRPVYFSTTVPSSQYKGLEKFFIQEGMAYRIVPVRTDESDQGEFGMIDPYVMYDNMMNKFKWGNAGDPSVYLDENNKRMFSNFRRIFGNLGKELLEYGDTAKAVEVAYKALEIVPPEKMPHDFFSIGPAEILLRAGNREEGQKLISDIIDYSKEYLDYAISLSADRRYGLDYPIGINMQAMLDIYHLATDLKDESLISTIEPMMNLYYGTLYSGN